MKYFSMFTGVGGFELGIEQAYDKRWKQPICVGFSEIDKYASELLKNKFPAIVNYGDATTIIPQQLPDFDLLVGGFPCQSFSIAGKRKGFDDTRGTLFFDIARILAYKKPPYLLLENVKGLLSHDGGQTFQTIIRVLTDLGYFVEWQVLNSKNFGVPQNRERVFIIGYLGGQPRQKVFPVGEKYQEDTRRTGREVAYTIDANYHKGTNTTEKSRRQLIKQMNQPTLSSEGGNLQPKIASPMRWVRTEKGKEYRRNAKRENGRDLTPFNDGYRELVEAKEDVTGTLTNALQKDALIKHDMRIRRLTPLECERLQGFPPNWTSGFSDTQRYKMMGNAVTVNVVEFVISKLFG